MMVGTILAIAALSASGCIPAELSTATGGKGTDSPSGGSTSEGGAAGDAGGDSTSNGAGLAYAGCIIGDGPAVFLAMSGSGSEPNEGSLGGSGLYAGAHALVKPGLVSDGDDAHTFHVEGRSGELSLDGASSVLGGFQPFSIELWVRPSLPLVPNDLIRFASGLDRVTLEIEPRLEAEAYDSFRFRYQTAAGEERRSQHFLELDDPSEIHHVVGVYRQTRATAFAGDGTADDMLLYLDGALVGATGCCSEAPMPSLSAPLQVGIGFAGALDDVAVYDRELTAAEIFEHFALGSGELPCTH